MLKVQLDRRPEAIPAEFNRSEVRLVKGVKPAKIEESDNEE